MSHLSNPSPCEEGESGAAGMTDEAKDSLDQRCGMSRVT
jgi:hypothetical protein